MEVWKSKKIKHNFISIFFIDPVIPQYFYVPEENIEKEQLRPTNTIKRAYTDSGLFLWNQAMFVLAQLLTAGLLHINELDPIRRYLPSYNRPRKGGRYSAFQVIPKSVVPLFWSLVLIINILSIIIIDWA